MSKADIAVIGAGIIGLSVAWRLAQAGARPRVLDAGSPSATRAAAGMLAPSFEAATDDADASESRTRPYAEPLFAFARSSLHLWRDFAHDLVSESGLEIDYRVDGVLGVALTGAQAGALSRRAGALIAQGLRVERLGAADVARLEPALAPGLFGGLLAPDEGQVDPRLVLAALARALDRRGVAIERFDVRQIATHADGVDINGADGAAVSVGAAIIAAGSAVHRIAGAARPRGTGVFPVKGEALALTGSPVRHVVRAEGAYLCPKADGRLIIGATSVPRDDTAAVDDARLAALRRRGEMLCPALRSLPEFERWSGLRPATADGAPIIGPDPDGARGLFYALGHYRNGVLLAPATAGAIVSWALSNSPDAAAQPFAPRHD